MEYLPDNPYTGQGTIRVGPFEHQASPSGKVGARYIDSNPQGIGRFYLSKDVTEFLADAVTSELVLSGYEINPGADANISGVIERLYYDNVDVRDASLELIVRYIVRFGNREIYAQSIRAFQKTPKSPLALNRLIRAATRESIHQFLHDAQEAKALPGLTLPSTRLMPHLQRTLLQAGHQPLTAR